MLSSCNASMAQVEFRLVKAKLLDKRTTLQLSVLLQRLHSQIGLSGGDLSQFSPEQAALLRIFIRLELEK